MHSDWAYVSRYATTRTLKTRFVIWQLHTHIHTHINALCCEHSIYYPIIRGVKTRNVFARCHTLSHTLSLHLSRLSISMFLPEIYPIYVCVCVCVMCDTKRRRKVFNEYALAEIRHVNDWPSGLNIYAFCKLIVFKGGIIRPDKCNHRQSCDWVGIWSHWNGRLLLQRAKDPNSRQTQWWCLPEHVLLEFI